MPRVPDPRILRQERSETLKRIAHHRREADAAAERGRMDLHRQHMDAVLLHENQALWLKREIKRLENRTPAFPSRPFSSQVTR